MDWRADLSVITATKEVSTLSSQSDPSKERNKRGWKKH